MPPQTRRLKDKLLIAISRTAVLTVAALAMLVVILGIFLPLAPVERAMRRVVEAARKRPFFKRGLIP